MDVISVAWRFLLLWKWKQHVLLNVKWWGLPINTGKRGLLQLPLQYTYKSAFVTMFFWMVVHTPYHAVSCTQFLSNSQSDMLLLQSSHFIKDESYETNRVIKGWNVIINCGIIHFIVRLPFCSQLPQYIFHPQASLGCLRFYLLRWLFHSRKFEFKVYHWTLKWPWLFTDWSDFKKIKFFRQNNEKFSEIKYKMTAFLPQKPCLLD